jgi:hypothetical protein
MGVLHIPPAVASGRPDDWDEPMAEKLETICLVSCVGAKGAAATPAKALYRSDWFIKARAYAEANGSRGFILSAKHGLVNPDDVISPCEHTLNTMGVSERRNWARVVQRQMDEQMPDVTCIVVLAGSVIGSS